MKVWHIEKSRLAKVSLPKSWQSSLCCALERSKNLKIFLTIASFDPNIFKYYHHHHKLFRQIGCVSIYYHIWPFNDSVTRAKMSYLAISHLLHNILMTKKTLFHKQELTSDSVSVFSCNKATVQQCQDFIAKYDDDETFDSNIYWNSP